MAAAEPEEVPVSWIVAVLLRHALLVVGIGAVGFAIALAFALRKEPHYSSTFSFVPQATQEQRAGGLAGLAGQLGLPVGTLGGQFQAPQFYAELLETREVLTPIARDSFSTALNGPRVAVQDLLKTAKGDSAVAFENTLAALRRDVIFWSVSARSTGVVTVRVRTRYPHTSHAIATALLKGLTHYNLVTRQSQASEERRFIEGRLADARSALRSAEDSLQKFLQGNRQFESASQTAFQRQRLEREVTLRQQVVIGLAQQNEDARIREVRDTPVLTVIEQPTTPAIPDPRNRVRNILLVTMIAVIFGMTWVLMREGWRRQAAIDSGA